MDVILVGRAPLAVRASRILRQSGLTFRALVDPPSDKLMAIDMVRRDLYRFRPWVLLAVAYPFILPENVLTLAHCVNLHCAPLPEYKGSWCASAAILDGTQMFGSTLHYMQGRVDTGPIIDRTEFFVTSSDTAKTIRDRAQAVGMDQVRMLCSCLRRGTLPVATVARSGGRWCSKAAVLEQAAAVEKGLHRRAIACFPENE